MRLCKRCVYNKIQCVFVRMEGISFVVLKHIFWGLKLGRGLINYQLKGDQKINGGLSRYWAVISFTFLTSTVFTPCTAILPPLYYNLKFLIRTFHPSFLSTNGKKTNSLPIYSAKCFFSLLFTTNCFINFQLCLLLRYLTLCSGKMELYCAPSD